MPVELIDWEEAKTRKYDLALYCLGYENRSSFVAKSGAIHASRAICVDFEKPQTHSYAQNRKAYEQLGMRLVSCRSANFISTMMLSLNAARSTSTAEPCLIFLDCSSMSRKVTAQILLLISAVFGSSARVCVSYAVSAYAPPPIEAPSYISEPVVPALAGWSSDVDKPPYVVVGLGYEKGRALGCLDYLEATAAGLLLPVGPDDRFIRDVKRVNEMLLRLTDSQAHIEYDLMQPFDAYQKIESLVYGAARTHRVVLIPLGPKIFSALSVMLGIDNYPGICVWRVSGGDYEIPLDRDATGLVACIDFVPPELSQAIAEPAFSN